ncbi:MAG: GNAT family N-acetyltransferase [Verrucomicrobia bacterium]|nr:GNAT family N-acetyltransferase [Verrucomicrobiota bacterium]MBI3868023.1 GNAT family N-acetyltransferase [Verrucomicrobiota bacterium]
MSDKSFLPDDLAPGDQRLLPLDFSTLTFHRVRRAVDPMFGVGYEQLWREFGALDEMETRAVIESRLAWPEREPIGERWFRYEMVVITQGSTVVAARDHVAIVSTDYQSPRAVVHMSHIVVLPEWRRTGVAAWLRAVPIQAARACLKSAGQPSTAPITLVAEMEHPDVTHEARTIRLKAYEKAGFLKIDPQHIEYHQPDFRSAEAIDSSGGPRPLPFALLVRRLGRESEPTLPSDEARHIIRSLYSMYALGFRAQDMAGLWDSLTASAPTHLPINLVPPTARSGFETGEGL